MISVCLASYNGANYIKLQLQSILSQLSADDEIIVSDDSSSDNTLAIIRSIGDSRIKVYKNEGCGVTQNFSTALSKATGHYIFLSDQDDVWLQQKVEKVLAALQDADLVLHDGLLIDKNGNSMNQTLFQIYGSRRGFANNLLRNTYVGCCMAFNKKILDLAIPIPKNIKMHDMWIALIAEKKGTTKLIEDCLIEYRRHDNNASTTSKKSKFSKLYQLQYRLEMLFYSFMK